MTARPSGGKSSSKRRSHRMKRKTKPQRSAKVQRNSLEKSRRAGRAGWQQASRQDWRKRAATEPY